MKKRLLIAVMAVLSHSYSHAEYSLAPVLDNEPPTLSASEFAMNVVFGPSAHEIIRSSTVTSSPQMNPTASAPKLAISQAAQQQGATTGFVESKVEINPRQPATLMCVMQSAVRHQVPLAVLLAINSIENGRNGQRVKNTDGSYDMGQFQINTIHLKQLGKYGVTADDVTWNGCYNADLAAWLLKRALNNRRFKDWDYYSRAAGYNSFTPKHNQKYRQKLVKYVADWDRWLGQAKRIDQ